MTRKLVAVNYLGPGGSRWFATGLRFRSSPAKIERLDALDHPLIGDALRSLKGEADLSGSCPMVLDQGNSETCWAHSAASLLYLRRKLLGENPTLQSPLYFAQVLYATYRATAAAGGPLGPLQDTGAELDDAALAFAKWGSVAFGAPRQSGGTDVPATADDLGNPIPLPELTVAAVETGAVKPFGGEYDIVPGTAAPGVVAAALDSSIPVWLGGCVNLATMNLQAGQIEQAASSGSPGAGGHARAIVGYRTVGGAKQFKILNSWGASWADAGYSWASQDVITQAFSLLPFEVAA